MMYVSLILAALAPAATLGVKMRASARLSASSSFEDFHKHFGRGYALDSDEGQMRRAIFAESVSAVQSQNAQRNALWTAGLNKLSDWSAEERSSLHGWSLPGASGSSASSPALLQSGAKRVVSEASLPEATSWMDLGSIATWAYRRNQQSCGSCWAFSTVAAVEAHYEIHTGVRKEFSIQQMLDCVPNPRQCGGTGGCKGGNFEEALRWVSSNISLEQWATEQDIPYLGRDGTCMIGSGVGTDHTRMHAGLNLVGHVIVPKNQPLHLQLALQSGPVAVAVTANKFYGYQHGVFDGCRKETGWHVDHGVVLVGYGLDRQAGVKFWQIVNSWGPNWGEEGSMRLLRANSASKDSQHCGWNTRPDKGIDCKPYPEKTWACGMCGIMYSPTTVNMVWVQ